MSEPRVSGLGQPGQRETTHVGVSSEVRLPFQVFIRSCIVTNVMIVSAYVIVAMPWIKFFGVQRLMRFWAEWWPGLWMPPMAAVIYHGYVLLWYRYLPEQKNRNWPPPYEAVSVLEAGLLTVNNADMPKLNYDEIEPQAKTRTLKVMQSERSGKKQRLADVPDLPGLPVLARALAGGVSPSERNANKYGHYSRREWLAFRTVCLSRGWMAWKNGHTRTGLYCTHAGLAVMRHVAKLKPVVRRL